MNVLESPNRIGTEVPDRAIVLDHERRKTGSQRLRNDLRRQQVHVRVDGSRGCDQALTGDDCRICPKHDVDAIHDVRITGPPDRDNATVTNPDRRLSDAEDRIDDDNLCDSNLHCLGGRLCHQSIPGRLGKATHHLVAALLIIALNFDPETGVT